MTDPVAVDTLLHTGALPAPSTDITSMIAYDLQCGNGHSFEGWFEDGAAFVSQTKKGLIACPVCNDTAIDRLPSKFAIKASQGFKPKAAEPREAQLLAHLSREFSEFVEKNFDNVGCNFAKEALKIHYGASAPRNIRGVSTQEEEKLLKQEGIEFIKLPILAPPESES
jgi:hypothetical protein